MLEVQMLGTPQIKYKGKEISSSLPAKNQALFYYLSTTQTTHSRLTLANLLWSDKNEKASRTSLRQAVYQLGKMLPDYIESTRETVTLPHSKDIHIDLNLFRPNSRQLHKLSIKQVIQAVDQYQGDFLDGFFVDNATVFEEWLFETRNTFHSQAVQYLTYLITWAHQQRQVEIGIKYARKLIRLEPWDENGYRYLMYFLVWNGQINTALAEYQQCQQRLRQELDIEPANETTALYNRIKRLRWHSPPPIPTNPNPLFGRQQAMTEIKELLYSNKQIITILGLGGIGKTSLALEIAQKMTPFYLDGVYWVDLGQMRSSDELVLTIADRLQLNLSHQIPASTQLIQFLNDKEMLLVLDNFEPFATKENLLLLNQLSMASKAVQMIITSRQKLRVRQETVYYLHLLTYPETGQVVTEAEISAYSALQLFISVAQQANPHFLYRHQLGEIIQICHLVEGLPLAIELAAALTEQKSCSEIAEQIKITLEHLVTPFHDMPNRQRNLEATFLYSWSQLSSDEQKLLAQLTIFQGEFTTTAVITITQTSSALLATLAAKSMVQTINLPKYRLHTTIHHYASPQLAHYPDNDALYQRYSTYYLQFVLAQPNLLGKHALQARQQINQELSNIDAAWRWAIHQKNWQLLDSAAETIFLGFFFNGHFHKILELFQLVVDHFQPATETISDPFIQQFVARLLAYQSQPLHQLGRTTESGQKTKDAWALVTDKESLTACIATLYWIKNESLRQIISASHQQQLEKCLQLAHQNNWLYWGMVAINSLAVYHLKSHHTSQAKASFEKLIHYCQQNGFVYSEKSTYNNLADTNWQEGAYQTALKNYHNALKGYDHLQEPVGQILAHTNLSICMFHLAQLAESWQHNTTALDLCRQQGEQWLLGHVYSYRGRLLSQQGFYADAIALFEQTLSMAEKISNHHVLCETLLFLAICLYQQNQFKAALEWGLQAQAKTAEHSLLFQGAISFTLGLIYEAQGNFNSALKAYQNAQALHQSSNHPAQKLEVLVAQSLLQKQTATQTETTVQALLDHFKPLFDNHQETQIGFLLAETVDPIRFCWHSYLILAQQHPQSAQHLLASTYQLLQTQAASLAAADQTRFLEQIPIHYKIVSTL